MRVLVTWGSRRGGTEGIGRQVADVLRASGHEVRADAADRVERLAAFDAVVVGGALYANRWSPVARRFVTRHLHQLRAVPVWLFSSGPLDDSASRTTIPPTPQVAALAARVGALGHVTFGGRLAPDAHGFPARAMARQNSGDWRDGERINAWATELAAALPRARPGTPAPLPAGSLGRLLGYTVAVGAVLAGARAVLLHLLGPVSALVVDCLLAVLAASLFGSSYFRPLGARDPLPTALAWAAAAALLRIAVSPSEPLGALAPWLPPACVFAAAWATGAVMAMMPAPGSGAPPAPAR
jgi:menaquinone-dependent protoporphyrinogen oxidase